jgi:hypothetical protein
MGMTATFRRLPDEDLSRLLDEPDLVTEYLAEEPALEGFSPFIDLDIDKAWHAIHFLLTGSAWEGKPPLNFVATGGTELGEDNGYGPSRSLTAAQVRKLAVALEKYPTDALLKRFDPKALTAADVYPGIWHLPPEQDDTRGYVAEHYERLRRFVMEAAAAGHALIISIA